MLSLLGATVLYQIVYQFFLHNALVEIEESEDTCDGRTDSPVCMETNLFRSWRNAELYDGFDASKSNLLKIVPRPVAVQQTTKYRSFRVASLTTPAPDTSLRKAENEAAIKGKITSWKEFEQVYRTTMSSLQREGTMTHWGESLQASQNELESRIDALPSTNFQMQGNGKDFDNLYRKTLASIRNRSDSSKWTRELEMIERQYSDRTQLHGRRLAAAHDGTDLHADFDKLYEDTLASLNSESVSAWAQDIESSEAKLEKRMDSLKSTKIRKREERERRFNALYDEALAAIHNNASVSNWANHLDEIRKRFESSHTTTHEPHNTSLLEEINDFGRELCMAPKRRHLVACKEFLSHRAGGSEDSTPRAANKDEIAEHIAALNSSFSGMQADHDRWMQNFSQTGDNYIRDLCSDPRRKTYKACATFVAESAGNSEVAKETETKSGSVGNVQTSKRAKVMKQGLRGASVRGTDRLLWSTVLALSSKTDGIDKFSTEVSSDELHAATWKGRIPKVACVAAVPVGRASKSRFTDFIREFREQTYEGAAELVLVYSDADVEITELVRTNVDGTNIKAVAARDGLDPMSTVALRYGAWSSNADVVASWRFDERHHPDRLAMQVRALALAKRSVSILKRWTLLSSDGDQLLDKVLSANPGWEGSLVGEKSWMTKHWMPSLGNERELLQSSVTSDIVQVDMAELSVYATSGPQGLVHAKKHFGLA